MTTGGCHIPEQGLDSKLKLWIKPSSWTLYDTLQCKARPQEREYKIYLSSPILQDAEEIHPQYEHLPREGIIMSS